MGLDAISDYFRSYDKNSFAVFACQGNEPTEADVAVFEDRIVGWRLPDEFREFTMSGLGGLYMEAREELWPRPQLYEVGPFWSFLYGVQVYGIAADIPDWLDIRVETERFRLEGMTDLVPFMKVLGDADRYCFDESGRVVHWSHEEPEERRVEQGGFTDVLMLEIRELEKRLVRKLQEQEGNSP